MFFLCNGKWMNGTCVCSRCCSYILPTMFHYHSGESVLYVFTFSKHHGQASKGKEQNNNYQMVPPLAEYTTGQLIHHSWVKMNMLKDWSLEVGRVPGLNKHNMIWIIWIYFPPRFIVANKGLVRASLNPKMSSRSSWWWLVSILGGK